MLPAPNSSKLYINFLTLLQRDYFEQAGHQHEIMHDELYSHQWCCELNTNFSISLDMKSGKSASAKSCSMYSSVVFNNLTVEHGAYTGLPSSLYYLL